MKVEANNFIRAAEIAVHDKEMQSAVKSGTMNAHLRRIEAMYRHSVEHGEMMRQQAARAKRYALRNLPELLEQAEANLKANGVEVLWAIDAAEANQHVLDIARKHGVKRIIKSKSMLTEELALNDVLEASELEVVETDLGEFIIQINHEHPSHIVAPVIHKTKPSIRDIFVRELGMTPTDDAQEMVSFARKHLREIFLSADMGISGGNFILAETGTLCLVTNEGNGRMVTEVPRVHVAMVGIEKVVATVEDYATLTQVLPRHGTGQNLTVYTHMVNGPRRPHESDGPEHVYVVLVDNGRSAMYANSTYAEALTCIRCGSCQNACPVYRSTGGNAYGWVYAGPIGAIVTPLLAGLENAKPLPNASSLCGACKQACPVDIDIPRMLLALRAELVDKGMTELKYDAGMRAWKLAMKSPGMFELGGRLARLGTNMGLDRVAPNPLGEWKKHRDFPKFADQPFRQRWKERQKGKLS
jgi:L-lactate dehydrogenase complex protein LldF